MVFNALAATLIKGWPSRLWHGTSGAGDLPERARRLFLLKLHKLRMPCHDKRRAALSDPRSLACIPGSPLRVVWDSGTLQKNIKLQLFDNGDCSRGAIPADFRFLAERILGSSTMRQAASIR